MLEPAITICQTDSRDTRGSEWDEVHRDIQAVKAGADQTIKRAMGFELMPALGLLGEVIELELRCAERARMVSHAGHRAINEAWYEAQERVTGAIAQVVICCIRSGAKERLFGMLMSALSLGDKLSTAAMHRPYRHAEAILKHLSSTPSQLSTAVSAYNAVKAHSTDCFGKMSPEICSEFVKLLQERGQFLDAVRWALAFPCSHLNRLALESIFISLSSLHDARPRPSVATLSSLQRLPDHFLDIFKDNGFGVDTHILNQYLQARLKLARLRKVPPEATVRDVLLHFESAGVATDEVTCAIILRGFEGNSHQDAVAEVLDNMQAEAKKSRSSTKLADTEGKEVAALYPTMARLWLRQGQWGRVESLLARTRASGLKLSPRFVSSILEALLVRGHYDTARDFLCKYTDLWPLLVEASANYTHHTASNSELVGNVHLALRIVWLMCKIGHIDSALRAFELAAVCNGPSSVKGKNYGPILTAILNQILETIVVGSFDECLADVVEGRRVRRWADSCSWSAASTHADGDGGGMAAYIRLFRIAARGGVYHDTQTYNILLLAASQRLYDGNAHSFGSPHYSQSGGPGIVGSGSGCGRTAVSMPSPALLVLMIYLLMRGEGLVPDLVTALATVPSLAVLGKLDLAGQLWRQVSGVPSQPYCYPHHRHYYSPMEIKRAICDQIALLDMPDEHRRHIRRILGR
ncbi:hypothetical protein EV182_001883 [Spiromyces aspiralis]|uniref:Uncharacterized protein n=1 Tax=Spiromyces aspiralis TaxID=68401 RepID=A0ACC1HFK3_9FUNG|nr:hypothetical protein EV182_001883 [Spiromyces aspiralis]